MPTGLSDQERCKARVKARLLGRPDLTPRIGRFELLTLLGQGGAGLVYEARDTRDGTRVALKLLSHVDARAVTRFKREFRALAELTHDNLVQLHELFADGDQWYFTMELVRGLSFTQYVRRREGEHGAVDLERLHSALVQLLRAVSFIHASDRVHCDLKPSNVLVTSDGRVVVLDFSLVSLVRAPIDSTPSTAPDLPVGLCGTPPFLAPELYAGAPHGPQSDAYALGMMLLQALNGLPAMARARAHARAAMPEFRAATAPVVGSGAGSEYLRLLCAGMLESDPAQRLSVEAACVQLGSEVAWPATRSSQPAAIFVGRSQELSLLQAALRESRQTTPIAVFISGQSGIGKSALCDQLAKAVAGTAVVLRGRCHEREALPYKAFDGLIDALVQHLTALPSELRRKLLPPHAGALLRMFPSLRSVSEWAAREERVESLVPEFQVRRMAFTALKTVLHGLAESGPLLLMVDDLQWADADSAELLLEVLGPPAAPRLLYVGCHRAHADADSDFLRALFYDASAVRWQCERRAIELGKLDEREAQELARQLLEAGPSAPQHLIEHLVREADGSPFLLRELALHLASSDGSALATLSLSDLFGQRISSFGPMARSALTLLALAARPLSAELLARALGEPTALATELRRLLTTGLVRRGRHAEWIVDHDTHRELVLHLADASQVSVLHRALATAYESTRSGEPEWLIEHWRAAGEAVRALEYSISAARAAAHSLAFNRAADLYETALALLPPEDGRRHQLQEEFGDACVNAGRSAEAAEALLAAVGGAAHGKAIALRCRAVQQHFRSGRTDAGDALLERLLSEVGVVFPRSSAGLFVQFAASRARLLMRSLGVRRRRAGASQARSDHVDVLESVFREILFVEPLRGALLLSLFHEAALASGHPDRLFVALAWETYGDAASRGRKARRRTAKRLARLSVLAGQLGTPYAAASLIMVRTAAAFYEHRLSDVASHAEQSTRIFSSQCRGAFWEETVCDALRYAAIEETGPLTSLCERAPVLLRRVGERRDHLLGDAMLCRVVSQSLLAQDQPARALAFLDQRKAVLERVLGDTLDLRRWLVVQCLVDCQSYAVEDSSAWDTISAIWKQYLRSPFARSEFTRIASNWRRGRAAVALAARHGDRNLMRIADQHARVLLRVRSTRAAAAASALLAALASQRGQFGDARRLLIRAEDAARQCDSIVPAYAAQLQRGRITPGLGGQQLIEDAKTALLGLGVTNPARWAHAFIGGIVGL